MPKASSLTPAAVSTSAFTSGQFAGTLFTLPADTVVYPGHDYKGRTESTVGEEKRWNPRLAVGRTVEEFADIMAKLHLAYPKKIDVALPLNLRCGVPRDLPVGADAPEAQRWAHVEVSASGVPISTTRSVPPPASCTAS